MSQTVPQQHPAVVLRSHYRHLRSLLAIAMIAVVGLTVTVVVLATDDDTTTGASAVAAPSQLSESLKGSARPDESNVASSIARPPAVAAPDESKVAAAIAARQQLFPKTTRPDESGVANAISGD